jgi:trans-feruloyl-CoA hydratase/vanillin synthase
MVNGYCFGGAFTPVCACDIAICADEATFGLSEVNWGVIPGGIVSWNIAQLLNHRDAMFYAMTGLPFDGKKAAEMKLVNYSVPLAGLREETMRIANILLEKNPYALRYTKEAVRHVRGMEHDQAYNFLAAKLQALQHVDKEKGMEKGLSSFLDEKKHRPGFGTFDR